MSVLAQLTGILESYAAKVPVELFTLFGTFIEEVVAPIPSPFVMATAGSIAAAQGKLPVFLLWLSVVGAVGKVFGALILYIVADKAEDLVMIRFGRFFGVNHADVEKMGKLFSGGFKNDLILFAIRAIPIIPSAPVSVISGVIKINLRTYFWTTLVGTFVKNIIYAAIGYSGLQTYHNLVNGLNSIESVVEVLLVLGMVMFFAYLYYRRSKTNPFDWLRKLTSSK